jgi:hypothetical protein
MRERERERDARGGRRETIGNRERRDERDCLFS